ncbi:MAG: TAXI family TRAP transporter solute-binding subunit, partial [Proteobacteria bacterium]|nr:TAXI family TRAP transporter solute-binding subunit [Pseudomonadota bacterium]
TWQAYVGKFVSEPISGVPDPGPPYPLSRNIRIVMAVPPMYLGLVVRNDSPMKEVADVRGKRVSWEFAGYAPNVASILCYLYAAGLTLDDVIPVKVSSLSAGINALVEGRLDATTSSVGMPATTEANAKIGVRHLIQNVGSPEWLRKAQIIQPGSYVGLCPAGEGASVRGDTPLWVKPGYVVSSTHVSDEIVFAFLDALWKNYKETWAISRSMKELKPETFIDDSFPIPVHTGAIKFYKDKGVWTPAKENRNKENL